MRITNHYLTMVEESNNSVEFIYCACNCGFTRPKYDKYGKERRFIKGHIMIGKVLSDKWRNNIRNVLKGRKFTDEWKKKMSEAQRGEKSHKWKGDNVSYTALHYYIRTYLPKTNFCYMCKVKPPKDVACITGIYNRDFKNWTRLCRSCHMLFDNVGVRNKIKQ